MTIKTPEQIADEIAIEVGHRKDSNLARAVAVGIERDRAQHKDMEQRRTRASRIARNRGCLAFEPDVCDVCEKAARVTGYEVGR